MSNTAFDFGFKMLEIAAQIPRIGAWFREVTANRTDEISVRVRDILPAKGEAEKALERMASGPPDTAREAGDA